MKKLILIFLSILLITTGCSYQELNEIAITTVIGLNYDKEKDEFTVSAQVFNFEKTDASSTNEGIILYHGSGKSIATAIRNIYLKYPQILHLGHLQLMILGKDITEEKTNDIFDYFLRSPETSSDCYVMVNKNGTAFEILSTNNKDKDSFSAKEILKNIESNELRQGVATMVNLEEFLSKQLQKGIDPVLPTIKYNKDPKDNSNTYINGLSVFHKNVITDELSQNASKAYNLINNNFSDISFDIPFMNTNLTILLIHPKSSVDLKVINDKVNVEISIKASSHITEIYKDINILKKENIDKISNALQEKLNSDINELLDFCDKQNVDVLGLKNIIYKHYNKDYEKFKDENIYDQDNDNYKINIKFNIEAYRHGSTYIGIGGNHE